MPTTTPTTSGGAGGSGGVGLESAIAWGRGEPGSGQPNENAGELHNYWLRCDRIVDSETPPYPPEGSPGNAGGFYLWGRHDHRFNAVDAVFYAGVYDSGGNHRIDTLLDLGNGTLTQVHFDGMSSTDPHAYWYLSTYNDQLFISIDARNSSLWLYQNGYEDPWEFIVQYMKVTLETPDESVFAQYQVSDGAFWLYNIASGDSSWYWITHYMKNVLSNQAETVFYQENASDGSVWLYNLTYQWLWQTGVSSVGKLDGTTYASLNATDGSIWAFNATQDTMLYKGKALKLYNADGTPTGYCELGFNSSGDGSYLQLGSGAHRGFMSAADSGGGGLSWYLQDTSSGQGIEYAGSSDELRATSASGTWWAITPAAMYLNDGSSTGTYEPSAITLTSGGSTVYIDAGSIGGTAYFQSIDVCVAGNKMTAMVLMTTPS